MTYQKTEPGNLLHKLQNILASEFLKRFCYIQTFFKFFFSCLLTNCFEFGRKISHAVI